MAKIVLMDLDGTISDPALGITNSILHALHKEGLDAPREDLLKFIGPPLLESFQKYYPQIDPWKGLEDYREYFGVKGLYENKLYPDTVSALEQLKDNGYEIFVATSKPEEYAVQIISYFGLHPYIQGVYGASMDETRVAKPEVIAYALDNIRKQMPVDSAVMVGDRRHDIEGAHANDLPGIGVLCGYGSRKELEEAGADCIVNCLTEIPEVLRQIEKEQKKQAD